MRIEPCDCRSLVARLRQSPRLMLALALLAVIIATLAAFRLWPKPPLASRYTSSVGVYDAHGQLLRLTLAKDDRYRLWLPLESISPDLVEAFLLQEDRWFYVHPGINPLSLLKGGWRTYVAREPRQGGSTITMQLARLIDANASRSLGGKIRQIARALQLELMYSKHDILEAYLNLVPFGGNIEGVGAASLIHFGKATQALSLPEIMTLVVIPQSPAKRSLIRDGKAGQSASLMDARRRLFERWRVRHPAAAAQAGLMTLALNLRLANQLPFLAPHVVNQLLARDEGSAREIHSTIDLALQRTLDRQVRRYVERHRAIGIDNAVAMLVDTRTLEVKALVGSADFHDELISGQVNGALAKRSPGSTLKPFIYALAMDQGLIHPLSVLKDAPTSFGPFSPENFDGTFAGPITAHDALIRSRNVPAVVLSSRLSAPSLYDFLKQAGVSRMLSEKHYGMSLALGGGDVTMEELVTLYAMLANRGVLRPLKYLRSATQPTANDSGLRLLSEEASFMTLDMLRDNPRPEGMPAGARVSVPVAWKTGTSWGFRDAWSVGIFGQYVLAVWIGRFDGEGNPAYVGVQAAAPLFFQIVDALVAGGGVVEPIFRTPPGLARVEVCAASGDLPNVHCPLKVESWFVPGKSPIRLSTVHRAVKVDKRTGRLACPPYDSSHVQEVVYEYWPSDLLRLFAQAGMPRRTPPAGECGDGARGMPPSITTPLRGAAYVIRHAQPEGNIVSLMATGEGGVDTLYWFVNDSYLAAARPGMAVQWTPAQAGTYLIRVLDPMGRADSREVIVTAEP